jgi:hypothetical protein
VSRLGRSLALPKTAHAISLESIMTAHTAEMSADLLCHRCGYNLRAHPEDAKCPECGEPVAESRRAALIPRRPAWRDSDPRWRRRMLVGVWILAFMPFMDVLQHFGWISSVPVPSLFHHTPLTLDQTFLGDIMMRVDQPLLFCMGVVLLFAKERGRHPRRLEWTRRWGIICSYVTLLLSTAPIFFITALVSVGIAALFLSMPLKYQPGVTRLFVEVSWACLRYGPEPKPISGVVLVAFSSVAILLACVPLFDALRSSAGKRLAAILVAPLALFSLAHLGQAGLYCIGSSRVTLEAVAKYGLYFRPQLLVGGIADLRGSLSLSGWEFIAVVVELAKWCIIFAIAIWLTIARLAPRRKGGKESAA